MQGFDYYKYHALGNDYIVIDPTKVNIPLKPDIIALICHRHFGIGSDGILYGPIIESDNAFRLQIFNPDGSEAEKSGNGIRIFSRYLFDAGYLKSNSFYILTLSGRSHVEILDAKASKIKVDMGVADFYRGALKETLNLNGRAFTISCLTVGNPHCIVFLDSISKELAMELGPLIEKHSLFPKKTNVQFLKVLDRGNIKIEIWERGAGYTLASGSSSVAAASAAFQAGLVNRDICVHMPGGTLDIAIRDDNRVYMTGSVSGVSRGQFLSDLAAAIELK